MRRVTAVLCALGALLLLPVAVAGTDDEIPGIELATSPVVGSLGSRDEDDVYAVRLAEGDRLSLCLRTTQDYFLLLFPPGSTGIFDDNPIRLENHPTPDCVVSVEHTALLEGTHYIDVFLSSGNGEYALEWRLRTAGGSGRSPAGVAAPAPASGASPGSPADNETVAPAAVANEAAGQPPASEVLGADVTLAPSAADPATGGDGVSGAPAEATAGRQPAEPSRTPPVVALSVAAVAFVAAGVVVVRRRLARHSQANDAPPGTDGPSDRPVRTIDHAAGR